VQKSGPIHGPENERGHVRDTETLCNVGFVEAGALQNFTHRVDRLEPIEVEWTGVKLPGHWFPLGAVVIGLVDRG